MQRSDRKRRTTANASSQSKVAVSGAITVAAGNLHQYAYMERGISKSRNISVKAESGGNPPLRDCQHRGFQRSSGGAGRRYEDSSGSKVKTVTRSRPSPSGRINKALSKGKKVSVPVMDGIGEIPSKPREGRDDRRQGYGSGSHRSADIWAMRRKQL